MADDNFDDDDDNAAMREMMGFSTFGMQKPATKTPLPPQSNASFATGSNAAPLSNRSKAFSPLSRGETVQVITHPVSPWSQGTTSNTSTATKYATTNLIPASLPPVPLELPSDSSTVPPRPHSSHHQHSASTYDTDPSQELVTTDPDPTVDEYDPTDPSAGYQPIEAPSYSRHTFPPQSTIVSSYYHQPSNPNPPDSTLPSQSHTTSFHPQDLMDGPVYTSPETGISHSAHEMHKLARGQVFNEKGDRIYFKPSFIEPNPWQELEDAKASFEDYDANADADEATAATDGGIQEQTEVNDDGW